MRCNLRSVLVGSIAFACAMFASNVMAQIYTNGTLSTGATAENGTAAASGSTWSEMQHDVGNTTQANALLGSSAQQGNSRLADDFIVPVGQTWTLTSMNLFSYKSGAPATPTPFAAYSLRIWNGRPGDVGAVVVCGDTTTNVMTASVDALMFRTFNTLVPSPSGTGTTRKIWRSSLSIPAACAGANFFTPGTYWVDWASTDTSATGHFDPPATAVGARAVVGANARQQNVGTSAWVDVFDAGLPAAAPDVLSDFPFALFGSITSAPIDNIFANGFE